MSPEEIKARFSDPDYNPGPVPDIELEWTPELLIRTEKMLRDKKYSEQRINELMQIFGAERKPSAARRNSNESRRELIGSPFH